MEWMWHDDEMNLSVVGAVESWFCNLFRPQYTSIVIPIKGAGTGRADPERASPSVFSKL
jgi:hypothetical protein